MWSLFCVEHFTSRCTFLLVNVCWKPILLNKSTDLQSMDTLYINIYNKDVDVDIVFLHYNTRRQRAHVFLNQSLPIRFHHITLCIANQLKNWGSALNGFVWNFTLPLALEAPNSLSIRWKWKREQKQNTIKKTRTQTKKKTQKKKSNELTQMAPVALSKWEIKWPMVQR